MNITFRAFGLSFDAEVEFTPGSPGRYSGPPEKCYPDDPDEIEFISLTCAGSDALFMVESAQLLEVLEEEAIVAASEALEPDYDPEEA